MYKCIQTFFFIIPTVISSLSIPTKFTSIEQAMLTLTRPRFFKHRILDLGALHYEINVDLEKDQPLKEWPLILTYAKKHKLERFPLLPIPSMTTTEIWNRNENSITGEINTRLLKMTVRVTATCDKMIHLNIESMVTSKNIIVPISNKAIEEDVCQQMKMMLCEVLEKMA